MILLPTGRQPLRPDHGKRPNGFVLTIALIIVSAIIAIVMISAALESIVNVERAALSVDRVETSQSAEGCMEEALLRLNWDNAYAGGSVTIGSVSCTIEVTGSGSTRTVTVSSTLNGGTYSYTAQVNLSPFTVTQWNY